MSFSRGCVSFRISAENLNPCEITEILGIEPDVSYKKGDPITSVNSKGEALVTSCHEFGFWSIKSEEKENEGVEQHAKGLLMLLESRKRELLGLSNKGHKMDFSCDFFSDDCHQPGFSINPYIMLKLGQLNIKLSICFLKSN